MGTSIFFYILLGLMTLINAQTTQSSLSTSFLGYPIAYQDIDLYSCIITTSTVIPVDTSTMCLTSTQTVVTTHPNTPTAVTTPSSTATTLPAPSTTAPTLPTQAPTTAKISSSIWTITSASKAITSIPLTTMHVTKSLMFVAPVCANQTIGTSCNISADPCNTAQPCLNLATCYPNSSIPEGYTCICVVGFEGIRCEIDKRACRPGSSCLYGGVCNVTSNATNCICPPGKTGDHCEYEIDTCANVSCKNNAQCRSVFGNWSCLCTNPKLYSGTYCEIKSSGLRVKEMVSRSFAGVAIGCISAVVGFVLIMDILKYCFNVDPVDRNLTSLRERRRMQQRRRKRGLKKPKQPVVAVRFRYIHA